MPTINVATKQMMNGDVVTSYTNTVGTTQETFTFLTAQETIILRNNGTKNINYTIGSNTGTIGKSESVKVTGSFTDMLLSSEQGTQQFEVWADEAGTKGTTPEAVDSLGQQVSSLTTSLAEITNEYKVNFYPKFKGANLWISEGESVTSITNTLTQMKNLNMNAVFICAYNRMTNNDLTGSTMDMVITDTQINGAIDAAKNLGFEFICIKPHVYSSGSIIPTDSTAYMTNWGSRINHYADLSTAKGLKHLVVVNEQRNVTNQRLTEWNNLISQVKAKGLKVMATYAGLSEYDSSVIPSSSLDSIGINFYPPIEGDTNISKKEAKQLLSYSYYGTSFKVIIERFKNIKKQFPNTNFFISEIGITRNADSLKTPAGWVFPTTNQTMQTQILYYSAFMTLLCERELLDGIMYWCTASSQATDTFNPIGNTELENIIKSYIPRGESQ